MTSQEPGTIPALMGAFTYTASNTARVNMARCSPPKDVKFEKVKEAARGDQRSESHTGPTATWRRGLCDVVKLISKMGKSKFAAKPCEYQNQFEIGTGNTR